MVFMLIEFLLPQIFIKASSGGLKYMKHCYYVQIPKPVVNARERRPDIQDDICATLGPMPAVNTMASRPPMAAV